MTSQAASLAPTSVHRVGGEAAAGVGTFSAELETEQIKAAIINETRAKAEEDARQAAAALAEAYQQRDSILQEAREEAERVRAQARAEAEQLKQEMWEAHRSQTTTPGSGALALVSSTEIAARAFPRVRDGFDPESVKNWLQVVELSHAILEEELDRARAEWEHALEALTVTRIYLTRLPAAERFAADIEREVNRARDQWERSLDRLSTVRPQPSESSIPALLVRTAQLETQLDRLLEYSALQVRALLDASAAQLNRLENGVGRRSG